MPFPHTLPCHTVLMQFNWRLGITCQLLNITLQSSYKYYGILGCCTYHHPPFHTGTRPGLYPSFGIHTGTLTRVRPGLNPGSRPCLRAGFRPGFATRLRHNRIVSVKKWRKTDERRLSARRGCFCRSGARIGSSVSCRGSKEQCRISDDCRRAGKARLSAHARVMSAENKSSQEKVQVHR